MPGAPRGSLPCLAPGRGVTFFETQTKLLQPAPDGYLTHSSPGLMVEPVLHLRQGQIGFRGNPGQQQLPLSFVHRRLPTGSMHRSFHQPRPPVRCRNLLGPTHTHMEIFFGEGASGRHRRIKKNGPQAIGKSRGGWTTKIHMVAADARTAITFALSPGQAGDGPMGRELLASLGAPDRPLHLLMDSAYSGNETIQLALDLGFIPVVPPPRTRVEPWEYDREMYKIG